MTAELSRIARIFAKEAALRFWSLMAGRTAVNVLRKCSCYEARAMEGLNSTQRFKGTLPRQNNQI